MGKRKHIVVLGAGFGGLTFCQKFKHPDTDITLVDRQNHHLFQPLLYQVATAGLSAPEVAEPIRSILSDKRNVKVLLDEVKEIDLKQGRVVLGKLTLEFDYLVLALGGRTTYFGNPHWEQFAPGLKSLDDALKIRRNILMAFEQAETEPDPEIRKRLMTMVVVGGGPTGVELAGAFAELARTVLHGDFRNIDPSSARVILLEAQKEILTHLKPELSVSAREQLESLGVEIRLNCMVKDLEPHKVTIQKMDTENKETESIEAENIIWTAGVGATPLTQSLGVDLDKAGRVKVEKDLSLPGHSNVFAIGDMALVLDEKGKPVPGVSPAAMQMADHVRGLIEEELQSGPRKSRPAFKYWDKGSMATIGRSRAVAQVGDFEFSGLFAWLTWLFIHLVFLVGFRNKVAVLVQWAYSYFAYKRGARIVFGREPESKPKDQKDSAGKG